MLIVAGTIRTKPEDRDQVLELAKTVMDATRQEDGCHDYVFTPDTQESDLIRLYELWESGEHLGAHAKTEHLADWRKAAGGLITGTDIKVYTISDSRSL